MLSWKPQTEHIHSKVSKNIGVFSFITNNTTFILYFYVSISILERLHGEGLAKWNLLPCIVNRNAQLDQFLANTALLTLSYFLKVWSHWIFTKHIFNFLLHAKMQVKLVPHIELSLSELKDNKYLTKSSENDSLLSWNYVDFTQFEHF